MENASVLAIFLFLFLGFAYLSMFLNAAYHVLSTLGPLPHTNDEAA